MQSRRPLTIEELAETAVIDLNSEWPFDPEYRFFDAREHVLEILGSLVTVQCAQPQRRPSVTVAYDVDFPNPFTPTSSIDITETVRLSHFSVQEYLMSNRLAKSTNAKLRSFASASWLLDGFVGRCCM